MSTTNSAPPGQQTVKEADSHRSIIKSTYIIGLGTLTSRVLGFFRDVILAKLLGTGSMADAFFVAFKIPNLFRDLVGEGAVNAAIVPLMHEYKEKKEALWEFFSVVLILAMIVLSVITILGILLAPVIVRLMAPGFIIDREKLELTIFLTKLLFPYLLLIGLTAYSMGILYTFRSFKIPAFSPCLLNIAMIVSAYFARGMKEPVVGLAIGVLVGGFLQLFVQIKPVFDLGIRFKKPSTLRHPMAMRMAKLLLPRMLGGGVYQLTVFIDTFCASLSSIVGPGGISAIYYANRIIQFPMGIFSVAMASAVLPTLSTFAHKNDLPSMKRMIIFSLENIFFIMCPTTVVLLLLSSPIIRLLFQRGEFDFYSTQITSWALAYLSIGLFSFGGIKILVTAFHSLQDTKTPVKVAALCLVINTALNFILMYPLKVGGIALASALAGTIDFLILFYILDKKLGGLNSGLLVFLGKTLFASALTGIVEFFAWNHLVFSQDLVKLIVVGVFGFVFYGLLCYALGVAQARKVWEWFRRGMAFE